MKVVAYGKVFELNNSIKTQIDEMSQEDMARRFRFGSAGDAMLTGEAGDYFMERFKSLGGMTPEISKKIGWDK